jgi:hypothetical protein
MLYPSSKVVLISVYVALESFRIDKIDCLREVIKGAKNALFMWYSRHIEYELAAFLYGKIALVFYVGKE